MSAASVALITCLVAQLTSEDRDQERIYFFERRSRPTQSDRASGVRVSTGLFDPSAASYPILDSFRTFCRSPTPEMRKVFEGLRALKEAS